MKGLREYHSHGQMSEAFLTAAFLSLSGGLQDAYTYVFRGGVFANAQTGNIVLLSQNLFEKNWGLALRYFIPVFSFVLGVAIAEWIRQSYSNIHSFHWRQLVVLIEIIQLLIVGFLPQRMNMLANAMVSFSCAMQVQAFRKVTGYAFSSTMCIGNLRSGTAAISAYFREHKTDDIRKAFYYFGIIFLFAVGAGLGGNLSIHYGIRMIWVCCGFLLISFLMMFYEKI